MTAGERRGEVALRDEKGWNRVARILLQGLAWQPRMKVLATFTLLAAACFLSSCDAVPDKAPKFIDADGQSYLACEGFVRVSTQDGGMGGASYSVKFTEKDGVARDLRGIVENSEHGIPEQAPDAVGGAIHQVVTEVRNR